MNENAKRWIAELRSGKWKQAKQCLRDDVRGGEVSFCCLGVANEISELGEWHRSDFIYNDEDDMTGVESDYLAAPVRDWLGMRTGSGDLVLGDGPTSLAKLNDEGAPFEQIANIIEKYADQLFE